MNFKPYTEKIKKKKIGICSILGRIRIQNQTRIRIHHVHLYRLVPIFMASYTVNMVGFYNTLF